MTVEVDDEGLRFNGCIGLIPLAENARSNRRTARSHVSRVRRECCAAAQFKWSAGDERVF